MTPVPAGAERESKQPRSLPVDDLNRQVQAVLNHAVIAHRDKLRVYESLRNLNEVVGTEYGKPGRASHHQISPIKCGLQPIMTAQGRIRGRMPILLSLSAAGRSNLGNPGLEV